jgi:iron complex transport system ATP-binding protein
MNNPYPLPSSSRDAAVLEIHEASVMRGDALILDRFSLCVAQGQHTAILGRNGSGKSTLVKLIDRQLYPLAANGGAGSVRIFGEARWNVAELRSLLGIVSSAVQLDYTSDTPLEVFDVVVSGFFAARGLGLDHRVSESMRHSAHEALRDIDAGHLVGRRMDTLSTGEARRVLIARALVHRPRALLLDEPCTGLDMASRRQFLEGLRVLARSGTTLLLVTHHVEEILPEIEQVALLQGGRLLRLGTREDTLRAEVLSAAFGLPVKVERHGEYYAASVR